VLKGEEKVMKVRNIFNVLLLLAVCAGTCTFSSCSTDDTEENGPYGDNSSQNLDIVVTVDANGNADGGHQFSRINETTFLIDGLKYKYEKGSLKVIGYDHVFFSGIAHVISKLIYNGRTMNVTSIGNGAFNNCNGLTSVTIPNSVTSIDNEAFCDCRSLTSVTIPNSVTSIGYNAFYGCSGLTSVHITDLSAWCKIDFFGIEGIPNPLYYAHHLYINGKEIKNLIIPNDITTIKENAFEGCTGLTSITIPNSVTSIGGDAFYGTGWYNAQPDGILYLDNWLIGYKGTKPTGDVTINSGTRGIADDAFSNCRLTSVTIPGSVTSIGLHAFSYCIILTEVYCLAMTPPNANPYAFDWTDIAKQTTLHVPAGSIESYRATRPWSSFMRIVAIE